MTYKPGQEPFHDCPTKFRRLLKLARAIKQAKEDNASTSSMNIGMQHKVTIGTDGR